jgi:hypothetical protein
MVRRLLRMPTVSQRADGLSESRDRRGPRSGGASPSPCGEAARGPAENSSNLKADNSTVLKEERGDIRDDSMVLS